MDILKKDTIESVLAEIIDIDEKMSKQLTEIESKFEEKEKELKRVLKGKEEVLDKERVLEGKRVYDEIMDRATAEKENILTRGRQKAEAFDALLGKNKEMLKEKAFVKLNLK
ncbi:MAG: hypothetical protein JJE29_05780 [Peptostreptococcaceae bacterium]|nr:hypothetical protein [Peptostreptococcaceae bacterium]